MPCVNLVSPLARTAGMQQLIEKSVIDEAQILFTTLNSSGHPSLEATEFCVTVVDEAAQCVEPSLLIALRRGCKQCILVGDQKQLPATVFSENIKKVGYDRSLFQRLIESGHPYTMLDTQYRMHPSISDFPSRRFYDGGLIDGANVEDPTFMPPFISPVSLLQWAADGSPLPPLCCPARPGVAVPIPPPRLKSFMFFDLASSRDERGHSLSRVNVEEGRLCAKLVLCLVAEAQRCVPGSALVSLRELIGSIGIITPYR